MHRTEHQLRQSLASLIHEKRYDAIVVKEILARADVLVASFFVVMDGWLDHAFRATAREAHDLYRALVEPAVRAGNDAFPGR